MSDWTITPPKSSAYYHAIPVNRDSRLDGNPIEVVYLYFNGRWSVSRPGMNKHAEMAEFSHWSGPIPFPDLPSEVADAEDQESSDSSAQSSPGRSMADLPIFYADDETGIYRVYLTDIRGDYYTNPSNPDEMAQEELRGVFRLVLKAQADEAPAPPERAET